MHLKIALLLLVYFLNNAYAEEIYLHCNVEIKTITSKKETIENKKLFIDVLIDSKDVSLIVYVAEPIFSLSTYMADKKMDVLNTTDATKWELQTLMKNKNDKKTTLRYIKVDRNIGYVTFQKLSEIDKFATTGIGECEKIDNIKRF
jgi:hypothetical protein